MANTSDIKKGLTIELNKDLWTIVDFQHVKPGKGGAFVRTKLKSLTSGKVVDNTFNSGESLTLVSIERRKHQFLYKDLTGYNFMDNGTFEQVTLAEELIDGHEFLKEGQEVEIIFQADNDRILGCDLPLFVFLDVTYSEPGLKGDTANMPMKNATLETGAIIQVPLFVESGTKVKLDTVKKAYVERVTTGNFRG